MVIGKGTGFVFASGGKSFREMVRQLFPLIQDDKIDLRTRELRDYLCDPKSLKTEVAALQLASDEDLDNAAPEFKVGGKKEPGEKEGSQEISPGDIERALLLRQLGNKLRWLAVERTVEAFVAL